MKDLDTSGMKLPEDIDKHYLVHGYLRVKPENFILVVSRDTGEQFIDSAAAFDMKRKDLQLDEYDTLNIQSAFMELNRGFTILGNNQVCERILKAEKENNFIFLNIKNSQLKPIAQDVKLTDLRYCHFYLSTHN